MMSATTSNSMDSDDSRANDSESGVEEPMEEGGDVDVEQTSDAAPEESSEEVLSSVMDDDDDEEEDNLSNSSYSSGLSNLEGWDGPASKETRRRVARLVHDPKYPYQDEPEEQGRRKIVVDKPIPYVLPNKPIVKDGKRDFLNSLPPMGDKRWVRLILDYLIVEGHKEAAELLCLEANLKYPAEEMELLNSRVAIIEDIQQGSIDKAIEKLSVLVPNLYSSMQDVRFAINLQVVIEFIRIRDVPAALKYAKSNIADEQNLTDAQLNKLERTFAMCAFEDPNDSPFNYLLDHKERIVLAKTVNGAMLFQLQRLASSRLETFLKMPTFADITIREKKSVDKEQLQLNRNQFHHAI